MSANLRVAYVTCNTTLVNTAVDTVSGVALKGTRIRGVHAQGVGEFTITGTSVDAFGNSNGGIIKFTNTTSSDVTEAYLQTQASVWVVLLLCNVLQQVQR